MKKNRENGIAMFLLKKSFLYLSALFVCIFAISAGLCARETNVVKLAAFNYPPFYYEKDNMVQGIAVELVDELFSRMNMKLEIKIYPLKRALKNLKTGRHDAIMILIKTPEREQYLSYTSPVVTVRGLIWWAADRKGAGIEFERLEDLTPFRIGVTRGYSYGVEFDNLLKKMTVEVVNSNASNFKKLLWHRIDAFPCNEIVAKGIFKNNKAFEGKFVHSKKAFIEWVLHMAISKKSGLTDKIDEINSIIDDFKKEGFINNTVKKYTED
ncbi:MAG: amino acid ABC transporter substrate-binding protein [Desulfobacteraceae bacterium]|nr:amino acid ABC transporter substrate-binding protein [Desulfobacteraceae bacterium]